jgi:hypothetical protein
MGLTPCRPSFEGQTLHQGREGPHDFQQVPDAETMTPDERAAMIILIKGFRNIRDN